MFGISFAELLVICLVLFIFIQPKDLPQIAYFAGRLFYKVKKLIKNLQENFEKTQKEIGLDEIKQEFNKAMIDEEINADKKDEIVDIYGNIHKVSKLDEIRSDLTKEELDIEIKKYNQKNSSQITQ